MDFLKILKEERARARRQNDEISKVVPIPLSCGEKKEEEDKNLTVECNLPVKLRIPPIPVPKENRLLDGDELIYLPQVISIDEEEALWLTVQKQANIEKWVQLKGRQSMMLGEHKDATGNHIMAKLPKWLEILSDQLRFFDDNKKVNHVLVNFYNREDGAISHHTDGPSYDDRVCILSLGGPVQLSFKRRLKSSEIGIKEDEGVIYRILMEPRSLLFFSGKMYSEMLHGIDPEAEIEDAMCLNYNLCESQPKSKEDRISLTFRHALKPSG